MGRELLAFVSHCSANFQPILDCFIPIFKLKYENSENIKVDQVDTVAFNLHQIKHQAFFGTPSNSVIKNVNGCQFYEISIIMI